MRAAKALTAAFLAAARRAAAQQAAAMALVAAGLGATSFGEYLDLKLFYEPARKAELSLGRAPALDPALRVVLLEDRSLRRLGRTPRLAEWLDVAGILFRAGIRDVYMLGTHDLEAKGAKEAAARLPHAGQRLFLGGVLMTEETNPRAVAAATLDQRLLSPLPQSPPPAQPETMMLLAPGPEALAAAAKIGHLNLDDPYRIRAAFRQRQGLVLPSLALLGKPEWAEPGRDLYVDFIPPQLLGAGALPALAFFGADGEVLADVSDKVKGRLAGATTAVLIPDAFTGSRFLEAPAGRQPAYFAPLSLLNDTLRDRRCRALPRPWLAALLAGLATLAAQARIARASRSLAAAAATALALAAVAVWLLWEGGWYLPLVQCLACGGAVVAVKTLRQAFETFSDRLKLVGELKLGQEVQKLCLPADAQGECGAWRWRLHFEPFGAMAGDWVQIVRGADPDEVLFVLGDVVGKGPSAALVTAVISSALREEEERGAVPLDPDRIATRLDRLIRATFRGEQYSTISFVHARAGSVRMATLGSRGAFALDGGVARRVAASKLNPLGMRKAKVLDLKLTWSEHEATPGGAFVLFSDGVLESPTAINACLEAWTKAPRAAASAEFFPALVRALIDAGKDSVIPDDRTILVVSRAVAAAADAGPAAPGAA